LRMRNQGRGCLCQTNSRLFQGLAEHKSELGAPLCPCRHYDDKKMEAAQGFWNCPCVPMRERKVIHLCLKWSSGGKLHLRAKDTAVLTSNEEATRLRIASQDPAVLTSNEEATRLRIASQAPEVCASHGCDCALGLVHLNVFVCTMSEVTLPGKKEGAGFC